MYAVIRDGGRQFTVREGDRILVDLRGGVEPGATVRFDVLLVAGESGVKLGTPVVEGAAVIGKVIGERKGEKLYPFKYRRRKESKTRRGHRQRYTAVKVEKIEA